MLSQIPSLESLSNISPVDIIPFFFYHFIIINQSSLIRFLQI